MNPLCDLNVRFFDPPVDLAGCFSVVYRAQLIVPDGGQVEDILLPEWSNIRVFRGACPDASLPGSSVGADTRMVATGPTTKGMLFRLGTTRMWGFGLFPEGLARLTDIRANTIANRICDAEKDPDFAALSGLADRILSSQPDDEVESELIFRFMREHLRPTKHLGEIRQIQSVLAGGEITDAQRFSEVTGISPKQLERITKRYFGFTPKALLRRQRFVRTLSTYFLQQPIRWTAVMDSDYYDQAHFTHEFREFMGMTPQQFAAMPHPIQEVFLAERARVWGSPAQALDRPE